MERCKDIMKKVNYFIAIITVLLSAIILICGCTPSLDNGGEHNKDNEEENKTYVEENKTYVIDFYINNVKQEKSLHIRNGADYSLPYPNDITKDSSSNVYFVGWCLDEQCKNILPTDYIFTADTKLYAKFENINFEAYKYTVDKGKATITGYNLDDTTILVVPNFINTFPVINIADFAFSLKKTLRTVIILDGIETIGGYAFGGCNSIENISLPSTLKTMSNSFADCSLLKSISIPENVNEMSKSAFSGCTSLESINVDENNNTYHSFGNCLIETASKILVQGCKNSIIPNDGSVISIHSSAFSGCDIVNISIPSGIKEIPNGLFYDCTLLQEIILPNTLLEIGSNAFSNCVSLSAIVIPNGVTTIKSNAFSGCSNLQNISIPNTLSVIENGVFNNCNDLHYTVDDNCKYIGNNQNPYFLLVGTTNSNIESCSINNTTKIINHNAFKNCTSLLSISIPSSVNTICDNAFYGCSKLETVNFANGLLNIGVGSFSGCSNILKIIIPDSVTYIGNEAFKDCKNLTQISIGCGLTELSNTIFVNCQNVKNLIIPNSAIDVYNNIFGYYTGYYVFYCGTYEEFLDKKVYQHNSYFANTDNCFFYSESQPNSNGNYWHYDLDNQTPVKW